MQSRTALPAGWTDQTVPTLAQMWRPLDGGRLPCSPTSSLLCVFTLLLPCFSCFSRLVLPYPRSSSICGLFFFVSLFLALK